MEKKESFDERYHASYAAKLKTIPLDKIENAIAKAIGELTHDHVECIITAQWQVFSDMKPSCCEVQWGLAAHLPNELESSTGRNFLGRKEFCFQDALYHSF